MKMSKGRIAVIVLLFLVIAGLLAGVLAGEALRHHAAVGLLRLGWFDAAIALHRDIEDDPLLTQELCDAAETRCKKLLEQPRYSRYSKTVKLYKTLQDHPAAVKNWMNRSLRIYASCWKRVTKMRYMPCAKPFGGCPGSTACYWCRSAR